MADVPYRAQQVVSTCQSQIQKSQQTLLQTETFRETLIDSTTNLEELLDDSQRAAYKAAMTSILNLHEEQEAYPQAIGQLQALYAGSAQATDFAAVIKANMTRVLAARSYDVHEDAAMKDFCLAIGEKPEAGEAADDEDDDFTVTDGGAFPNEKCPVSAKSIFDLKEPVQDEKGYVYEKEAILHHIKEKKRLKPGHAVHCPVAGASHYITEASLRKAPQVAREKRKRELLKATQSQAGEGSGPSRKKNTVLQVEDEEEEAEDE